MKKIIVMLSMVLGMLFLTPVPANASCTGPFCGTVIHKSPDDGYDAPFRVSCKWSGTAETGYPTQIVNVAEGQTSKQYCNDMDAIYVRAGEELHCYQPQWWGGWTYSKMYDATGWYKVNDAWNYNCVNQLD